MATVQAREQISSTTKRIKNYKRKIQENQNIAPMPQPKAGKLDKIKRIISKFGSMKGA